MLDRLGRYGSPRSTAGAGGSWPMAKRVAMPTVVGKTQPRHKPQPALARPAAPKKALHGVCGTECSIRISRRLCFSISFHWPRPNRQFVMLKHNLPV